MFKTVEWVDGAVRLIDQRVIPAHEKYIDYKDHKELAQAITDMVVRGAPAIGVTAAMGAALGAKSIDTDDIPQFMAQFETVLKTLAAARPTAVNLFWAVDRMRNVAREMADSELPVEKIKERLEAEAVRVYNEDLETNKTMGENGARLISIGDTILTHCNAGALATAGNYGTALGVIKAAHLAGKKVKVYADETRPWLQGARLTTWELMKENIPVTLIADNMAGHCMKKGLINKVVVGADRIAANGDAANKIGTYSVAALAKRHNIPFFVAAPMSTIDFAASTGDQIPIEERDISEVTNIMGGERIAPEGVDVFNPAFDVTPNELISGIITEKGVATAPFTESLAKLRKK
ncbi:Methylthioribose-1-phosphate isomerase [hydrothermal vent metagenome]|uniref:Methylthioribose-1-phosphate isomerase n=1 Tax=hydrothermal vent metagenome TaxID=652676 RepID=A0A3B1CRG8_9ZZZZ